MTDSTSSGTASRQASLRVGTVLLVDSAPRPPNDPALLEQRTETRTLLDGTEHLIAKRYWTARQLTDHLTDRG